MLSQILNSIVAKFKGEKFILDKRVPFSRILYILFNKVIFLLSGVIKLRKFGLYFISPSTKMFSTNLIKLNGNLNIDHSCLIDALSSEGISFGKNVSIHSYCSLQASGTLINLGKGIKIGNNVGVGRNCHFGGAGGIFIGDDTIFGQYVSIHSENHVFTDDHKPIRKQGVSRLGIKIGSNCWVGAKVTILDGAVIGDGCIIAAGALVIAGTYENNTIYAGVPAKKIKKRF
jgi:acetyltransferase-like isoleucine patch superfamily enzyme